ncbi:uncharacterized protein BP5553_07325 [Venustampulla echinocandica]|uniref:Nephrocystin 3-like N-terminal domain-containing protein n=1 Tax=Venustampulla echinocandica TaxID=2656787 RepID=A0A370TJ54_9HELO|nr:uncharacterized protein BP5553_07325 [Venustampulla echinocandica]RDL35394.1 hypothetical protein BP5553_07325 [Venustampulla echinocandica]
MDDKSNEDVVVIGSEDVRDFNPDNILPLPGDSICKIRSWLNPTEFDCEGSEYRKHLYSHLAGTGRWVFSSSIYQQWHGSQKDGILWIRGIPGSGKSVLAATLIEQLSQEGFPVLYFFCRHTIQANHSPESALRDWLAQVLDFSPPLQHALEKMSNDKQAVEKLTAADLWPQLRMALSHVPKVYCVVDALDEMDQNHLEAFIQSLDEVGRWRPAEIKLIITSRPISTIEKTLRRVKVLDIRLDKEYVEQDIATYVDHRLASSSISIQDRPFITKTVMDRADGLFLYAKLAMDTVLEPSQDPQKALQDIPTELSLVYTNLLREHSKRSGVPDGLQELVLQCVTHAIRPLRLLEIADLIHVTQQVDRDIKDTKALVCCICGPLLEILPDETVRVVHHSLTEYLNGTTRRDKGVYQIFEFGATHNFMALLCLSYLQSGCLEHVKYMGDESLTAEKQSFAHSHLRRDRHILQYMLKQNQVLPPFTHYAADNWYIHVRNAAFLGHDQTAVNSALHNLLVDQNLNKVALLAQLQVEDQYTPLFLAVALHLEGFAKSLLDLPETKLSKPEKMASSPISFAARKGLGTIVRLLLKHGADPTEHDDYGFTPLHAAVLSEHPKVATLFLDAGVDPFIKDTENKKVMSNPTGVNSYGNPALSAFSHGNIAMGLAFLPYLKTSKQVTWALIRAVDGHNAPIVEVLLQHPMIDVNARCQTQATTPLQKACNSRDADIISLLLKAGADPNIPHNCFGNGGISKDGQGSNTLHALASFYSGCHHPHKYEEQWVRCFKLVLEAGAKVDQIDIEGNTPLHGARDVFAVRCLLDGGANPNAVNQLGETLFHNTFNKDIINILKDKADVNLKSSYRGQTPLVQALSEYFPDTECVEKAFQLLDLGADVNIVDNNGNSALHLAMKGTRKLDNVLLQLIERLVAGSGDTNLRNLQGQTPLHNLVGVVGCGAGHRHLKLVEKIVTALLDTGANLEIKDSEGKTPLFRMVNFHHSTEDQEYIDLCEKMIEFGARIDTIDSKGRNLLYDAVLKCQAKFIKYLIERGVDPRQTDYDGNTVWHEAAPRFAKGGAKPEFLNELLAFGFDPAQPNHVGQTALHILSNFRPVAFDPSTSFANNRGTNLDCPTIFNNILDFGMNVNCADSHGVTPLHITSTFSEYLTRRLLQNGADPSKRTVEGLTALHLAARSRQANIIGIMLESLKSKFSREEFLATLNAKDMLGRTPLYYACASGLVESAQLLLNAGAILYSDSYRGSALQGCVGFEEEQKTADWSRRAVLYGHKDHRHEGGGVLISDTLRPEKVLFYGDIDVLSCERLDDILELLASSGSDYTTRFIDEAIADAVEKKFNYTVECLLRTRETLSMPGPYQLDEETSSCLQNRQDTRSSLSSLEIEAHFLRLMSLRDFDLASRQLLETDCIELRYKSNTVLHDLVSGGFASILSQVATHESLAKLENVTFLEERKKKNPYTSPNPVSLLAAACKREVPNMNVIRVLVEHFGLAIQTPVQQNICIDDGDTALHFLVSGNHWWQIAEALPYLVGRGANMELRGNGGLTPLNASLEGIGGPNFNRPAVEILLELGADANSSDDHGVSCLVRACKDREIFQLLLRHGAIITHAAMTAAIDKMDVDLLETMLSNGADPNIRRVEKEVPSWTDGTRFRPPRHDNKWNDELYLLEYVNRASSKNKDDRAACRKMFKMLLDHGADPCARYERTTVLHGLLTTCGQTTYQDSLFPNILPCPKLDLEIPDSNGLTAFLRVCSGRLTFTNWSNASTPSPSLIKLLLDRGANIQARADFGMNALHLLFSQGYRGHTDGYHPRRLGRIDPEDLERINAEAPELLNELDSMGNTPLHYAISGFKKEVEGLKKEINGLITAGADVSKANKKGDTPLHLLVRGEWHVNVNGILDGLRPELLSQFLSLGANINGRNQAGETPIFAFFRNAKVSVKTNHSPLSPESAKRGVSSPNYGKRMVEAEAAVEKERLVWGMFEKAGVDWMLINSAGQTLLHVVAADSGHDTSRGGHQGRRASRFKFLMEKGLDPMQEDDKQRTALDVAAALKNEDILQLFKRK